LLFVLKQPHTNASTVFSWLKFHASVFEGGQAEKELNEGTISEEKSETFLE
jgi:hypothetical protein